MNPSQLVVQRHPPCLLEVCDIHVHVAFGLKLGFFCAGMSQHDPTLPGWIWTNQWRATYRETREGRQWQRNLVGLSWDTCMNVVTEKWQWTQLDDTGNLVQGGDTLPPTVGDGNTATHDEDDAGMEPTSMEGDGATAVEGDGAMAVEVMVRRP